MIQPRDKVISYIDGLTMEMRGRVLTELAFIFRDGDNVEHDDFIKGVMTVMFRYKNGLPLKANETAEIKITPSCEPRSNP